MKARAECFKGGERRAAKGRSEGPVGRLAGLRTLRCRTPNTTISHRMWVPSMGKGMPLCLVQNPSESGEKREGDGTSSRQRHATAARPNTTTSASAARNQAFAQRKADSKVCYRDIIEARGASLGLNNVHSFNV